MKAVLVHNASLILASLHCAILMCVQIATSCVCDNCAEGRPSHSRRYAEAQADVDKVRVCMHQHVSTTTYTDHCVALYQFTFWCVLSSFEVRYTHDKSNRTWSFQQSVIMLHTGVHCCEHTARMRCGVQSSASQYAHDIIVLKSSAIGTASILEVISCAVLQSTCNTMLLHAQC
jgi:hypothetical protein